MTDNGNNAITIYLPRLPRDERIPDFPKSAYRGWAGKFASVHSRVCEAPKPFFYASALTYIGAILGRRLKHIDSHNIEPRLYTVLIGISGLTRKSTALKMTSSFFRDLPDTGMRVLNGVGSAEGLANVFEKNTRVLVSFDELKAFVGKATIRSSVLLPMFATLFEDNVFANPTKKRSIDLKDAQLSVLAACTGDTFESMWTASFFDLGFINRLFLVAGHTERIHAMPKDPLSRDIARLRREWHRLCEEIPTDGYVITSQGWEAWENWYGFTRYQGDMLTTRLDTIGLRLMLLIAFTRGEEQITVSVINDVIAIIEYELAVRRACAPVDALNSIAELEQKILRLLDSAGSKRVNIGAIRRDTHAQRHGLWAFEQALRNLTACSDIVAERRKVKGRDIVYYRRSHHDPDDE